MNEACIDYPRSKPGPAQPIHGANLHMHIQGFKISSVQLHDGDAVAKERSTPSPQRLGLISSSKSEQRAAGITLPARARRCFLLQRLSAFTRGSSASKAALNRISPAESATVPIRGNRTRNSERCDGASAIAIPLVPGSRKKGALPSAR